MRIHPRYPRVAWLPLVLGSLLLCAPLLAGQKVNANLFSRDKMTAIDLKGLHIWMGKPVQITAQLGWKMEWDHGPGGSYEPTWAFIHLVPSMGKFPDGNLIVTYALDPDTQDNPYFLSAFQISKDGGEHWGRRYGVVMTHQNVLFIPEANDSLLGLIEPMRETPGDARNFVLPAYLFEHGGDRMLMTPDGIHVRDWPWDTGVSPSPQPRDNWHGGINPNGNALKVGNRILATAYGRKQTRDKYDSTFLMSSEDEGYTWRYFSTVAGPDLSHAGEVGFEGANESDIVQLADGDLMVVYRTGNGQKWHLFKTYSHDGGHTWTKPEAIPAYSVWPRLIRTADGTIVLATGRPGLDIWFSTDPRGNNWQKIDLAAYHNKWAPDPSYRIGHYPMPAWIAHYVSDTQMWETTAYTGLIEVAPNKLLLLYDRDPEQAPKNAKDLSRLFILPIEVGRQ